MQNFILSIFSVDSIWSVVARGVIWMVAVIILAYGADEGLKRQEIKAQAGLFFLFLTLTGVLVYFIFGFSPTA